MRPQHSPARQQGSAAVELIAIIPFALVLMAAIMDLRGFAMHRSDIAREMYTIAEVVAGAGLWPAATAEAGLRKTMRAAVSRVSGCTLAEFDDGTRCGKTAGWMRVVVIARPRDDPGDPAATPPVPATPARNSDGNLCNPTASPPFCEPEVLMEVDLDGTTAGIQRAEWNNGGDCGACGATCPGSSMPTREGQQFPRGDVMTGAGAVLPNEGGDPTQTHDDWVSRTLNPDEWWAVVEVCTHFGGGDSTPSLFEGAFSNALFGMQESAGAGFRRIGD